MTTFSESELTKGPLNLVGLVLIDFSLTVKVATLIFISGWGPTISPAEEGKSGSIYKVKN